MWAASVVGVRWSDDPSCTLCRVCLCEHARRIPCLPPDATDRHPCVDRRSDGPPRVSILECPFQVRNESPVAMVLESTYLDNKYRYRYSRDLVHGAYMYSRVVFNAGRNPITYKSQIVSRSRGRRSAGRVSTRPQPRINATQPHCKSGRRGNGLPLISAHVQF